MASAQLTWGSQEWALDLTSLGASLGLPLSWTVTHGPLMLSPQCCRGPCPIQERGDFWCLLPLTSSNMWPGSSVFYLSSLSFPTRQRGYRRACLGIITSEVGPGLPGYPVNCKLFIFYPLPSAKILVLGFSMLQRGRNQLLLNCKSLWLAPQCPRSPLKSPQQENRKVSLAGPGLFF